MAGFCHDHFPGSPSFRPLGIADVDARAIDGAAILEFRDGAFHDLGADVRNGARPVHLFNARPDQKQGTPLRSSPG